MEAQPLLECEVCGSTEFNKDSGHFYCSDCQTQSQEVQEHVFDRDESTVNKKSTRKIQQNKPDKTEDQLTSWECFNYVLKGLTQEVLNLGAKPELLDVVRCLWMKYLHKCEVFNIKSNSPPKVSIIGCKKDVAILYNIRKRKRAPSRRSSTSTILSSRRERSGKKRALVLSQYEEMSQSHDASLAPESLSSLKSPEGSESGKEIKYNKFSTSELRNMMSSNHWKKHRKDVDGELSCHKLNLKQFRTGFQKGSSNLNMFTLYGILYIALRIVDDPIQLGDLLRFIREGHVSYACYRHFFDENISKEALNLRKRQEFVLSHSFFRKRCAELAQFLDVSSYMETPDLVGLCSRYCTELNLPDEVFQCAKKIIVKTRPKMAFNKQSKAIPNYEGRVVSIIAFVLKLLFGLDGATELKLSEYARMLNRANPGLEMFDFERWLQFIGYRREVIGRHHLPSFVLRPHDLVDSDMYLHYLDNHEVKFKGSGRRISKEIQDYLQVLEKVAENLGKKPSGVVFEPSLTPFLSYSSLLLDKADRILRERFSKSSLEHLLRPENYLKSVGNRSRKNGGANDNIAIEEMFHLHQRTVAAREKAKKTVAVLISEAPDRNLEPQAPPSLKTTNVDVFLGNWDRANKREFAMNKELLKLASEHTPKRKVGNQTYPEHYNPFERYWVNVPIKVLYKINRQDLRAVIDDFPHSFKILASECSRVAEQDVGDFFCEFMSTELCLVYLEEFGCKSKKDKTRGLLEIRHLLKYCKHYW